MGAFLLSFSILLDYSDIPFHYPWRKRQHRHRHQIGVDRQKYRQLTICQFRMFLAKSDNQRNCSPISIGPWKIEHFRLNTTGQKARIFACRLHNRCLIEHCRYFPFALPRLFPAARFVWLGGRHKRRGGKDFGSDKLELRRIK